MRVLFLYPYLPAPHAPHGSARLISALLRDVKDEAEVTLICAHRPREREWIDSVRPLCHRLVAVERPFKSDMGRIARTSESGKTVVRRLKTGYPVPVVKLRRSNFRRAIGETLAAESFDVAHVELATLAQYGDLLRGVPSLLVDHEAAGSGDEEARWASYVKDTYPAFTRCACLSEEDAAHLRSIVPGLEIGVRPPGIEIPASVERAPEPDRVLFFGSSEHAPNRDALAWIASEVLPALRQRRPDVRLVCAGFRDEDLDECRQARTAGVEMLGFVDDLGREIARASVVLAPVRSGRGVRIKNLETLAHGAPLVTTKLGARGMSAAASDGLTIAEGAVGLADAVASLLVDRDRAEASAVAGRNAVARAFTFEAQARWTLNAWSALAGES